MDGCESRALPSISFSLLAVTFGPSCGAGPLFSVRPSRGFTGSSFLSSSFSFLLPDFAAPSESLVLPSLSDEGISSEASSTLLGPPSRSCPLWPCGFEFFSTASCCCVGGAALLTSLAKSVCGLAGHLTVWTRLLGLFPPRMLGLVRTSADLLSLCDCFAGREDVEFFTAGCNDEAMATVALAVCG